MDLGRIFRRAWDITWHYRILWIFGFLAAITSGPGGGGQGLRYTWRAPISGVRWGWGEGFMLVLVTILALLVAVALIVLAIIARGALIDGVRQAKEKGSVSGQEAWQAGVARFWSLLGINILLFVVIILLILPMLLLIALAAFAGSTGQAPRTAMMPVVCLGMVCSLPLILVGLALNLIKIYADRACVLKQLGSVEAIGQGWETLKNNIGPTLVVGVLLLAIHALVAAVFAGGVVSIALPSAAVWRATRHPLVALVPLFCFGSIGLLVSLLVGSIVQTFTSAVWTLTYMDSKLVESSVLPAEPSAPAESATRV